MLQRSRGPVVCLLALLVSPLVVLPGAAFCADTVQEVAPETVRELEELYRRLEYSTESARRGHYVLLRSFPGDFHRIRSVDKKKRLFERVLLPLIYLENERIRGRRSRIHHLRSRVRERGPRALTEGERNQVRDWLLDYNVVEDTPPERLTRRHFDRLLNRVHRIPPSLVLAQAANESGWGTSRFVRRANNLFGERTYDESEPGIKPRGVADTAGFRIRAFESLRASVSSYLHTLNSHWAYDEFRQLRDRHRPRDVLKLVDGLSRYSEHRDRYIERLVSLIKYNRYRRFDRMTP